MPPPIIMRQTWRDLLFLHWSMAPEVVAATLPSGLEPDCFEGRAWVAVVPFFMAKVRPVGCPPVPGLSWFLELNVRTYVQAAGTSGVWFYSLDCNQPIAVEIARTFFGLPYQHASMRADRKAGSIEYTCRRRGTDIGSRYEYAGCGTARPAEAGSLEAFLVERYHLIAPRRRGGYHMGEVRHHPYQLARAETGLLDVTPLVQAGLPDPARPPDHLLYAQEVRVGICPTQAMAPCS